jgi:hypothetical protein
LESTYGCEGVVIEGEGESSKERIGEEDNCQKE